jgi:phosphoribosylformimino-5-aminoimidazole carboxamide ribotide isomerase
LRPLRKNAIFLPHNFIQSARAKSGPGSSAISSQIIDAMEVIPAIDLLGGRCVRLFQGDFDKVTEYDQDPVEIAGKYLAAGAKRLHVVDLDGASTGSPANLRIIRKLASDPRLVLQVGGGIRSRAMVDTLLAAGAGRVVVGSIAVNDPPAAIGWLNAAGAERLVLAFDVKLDADSGEPMAVTHGWREASGKHLWDLMEQYLAAGARHFLCTDVGRDGTLAGPNVALYADCVRRFPKARVIASGGLGSAADLPRLAATGVAAVVAGKALLDGRITLAEIRQFSPAG